MESIVFTSISFSPLKNNASNSRFIILDYQKISSRNKKIVFFSNGVEFVYLEDYPINLIDELPQRSGHNATRVIAIVMEYGKDFSGPGNDVFRINRATGEPAEAHHSNFLHPVLYYYDKLPTGKTEWQLLMSKKFIRYDLFMVVFINSDADQHYWLTKFSRILMTKMC